MRHGAGRPLAHVLLAPSADLELPDEQVKALRELLAQFLSWKPMTPSSPRALAEHLAPLTSFLRDSVISVLQESASTTSGLPVLYEKWQADLMPGATHKDFADSFAQTFTYALLLARIESGQDADTFTASAVTDSLLRNGHKLIGSVLRLMAQPMNRAPIEGAVSLLESVIGAVNAEKLSSQSDPWLYFYEDFLAAYDPKMRNDAGVYYTPVEVVRFQVRLLDEILKTRFGRQRGFGEDGVNILDPAAGTGAYLLAVAERVLSDSRSPQADARSLGRRLFGFELLVGPYSVAHLRLTQMLEQTGVDLGRDGVQVFLTNTLTDPGDISGENQQISFWEIEQNINEETRRAGLVKNEQTRIRVILGNPPYDRGSREKALGSGSEQFPNVILEEVQGRPPLLNDFIEPLQEIGAGGHAKNLYNSYVYFIRWAIWKACEQHKDEAGVVSFITSASYLRGPGFAGMREYMRRVFDEIWIVDLGGEGRGARKEENVFNIQTPVAIFFGIQWEKNSTGTVRKHSDRVRSKAQVHYVRIQGTRDEKLAALRTLDSPDSGDRWTPLKATEWHSKFVPDTAAGLAEFAPLDWVFPWSHSGVQFKRKWPIAPTERALERRWRTLTGEIDNLSINFRETSQKTVDTSGEHLISGQQVRPLTQDNSSTAPVRYGYRSFDRQFVYPDSRLCDRPRPQLWDSLSEHQLYFATLTTTRLGTGPAFTVSPYVPDLDYFRGSFGAKNIYPLFRTSGILDHNISAKLLGALDEAFKTKITAEDVALYAFGLLGTGAYTALYEVELDESAARVPFTQDFELFKQVRDFGQGLIFEQTWGERCSELNQFGQPIRARYRGQAVIATETPRSPYPEQWNYDEEARELVIGDGGVFRNVPPEIMSYSVSGMKIVGSWLGYRMKIPAGRSSSPLDQIQADDWQLDRELLELLWQVEYLVEAESEGIELLGKVVSGPLIPVTLLGPPTPAETKAPKRNQRALL
ncbi:type ISP restriction/modification enzyme [Flaviflexus salsibiostraticola]|uniref:type ISP restriction/modification enzyme n=1 Tax=Flaviflexus salsibiostraticola TaxID=1282737 RepID=UPI0013DE1CF4|nr:type ISP restriction/modification enzyme [Flaviflexus salsibiostraticola]